MQPDQSRQSGFTIIELLVATLVFSLLLVVMLAAFIRTGDMFYKGVSMIRTQEDSRNIVQSITDDIKFTKNPPLSFTATYTVNRTGVFCVGLHRYQYSIGTQLGAASGNYGIQRDTIAFSGSCVAGACTTNCTELLDTGMQLNALNLDCAGGRCIIGIHVVFYGGANADELFSSLITPTHLAPDAQCKGGLTTSDLCATADYSSTVLENI